MSDTRKRFIESLAREALKNRGQSYEILGNTPYESAERGLEDGFAIALPFAADRRRFFGTSHVMTKFGNDLLRGLDAIQGVAAEIGSTRDVIHVSIDTTCDREPAHGYYGHTFGMPESVCLAIQIACMRKRSLFERFGDWLRWRV